MLQHHHQYMNLVKGQLCCFRVQVFVRNYFKTQPALQKVLMMTQSQPTVSPKLEEPKFGFNEYAERLNGRAAMIGFLLVVVIEYVTDKGVLSWLGLK
jgi:hypothetical protein